MLGVEGVFHVVEELFKENSLEHDKESVPEINGWRFRVRFCNVLHSVEAKRQENYNFYNKFVWPKI